MTVYPDSECFDRVVVLHRDGSLEAHKLSTTHAVKDGLGRRSVIWSVLQAVCDKVLHIWPWGAAIALYVPDGLPLCVCVRVCVCVCVCACVCVCDECDFMCEVWYVH